MLLLNRQSSVGVIVTVLVLVGIGIGCAFQPTLVALQAHSPKSRRAVVISTRNFFRCSGGSFGLAASAAVLQAAMRASLPAEYSYLANSTYSLPKGIQGPGLDGVLNAYMAASRAVFILQVPILGLCLIGCFFVKDRGLEPPEDEALTLRAAFNDVEGNKEETTSHQSVVENILVDKENGLQGGRVM